MTTKAPNMEPLATPNDTLAAPPAGGASAAPVWPAPPAPDVRDADAEPPVAETLELANDAMGPIALLLTVLTAPEIVARELSILATLMLKLDTTVLVTVLAVALALALALALADAEGVAFCGNVTWMRISSHWEPIHSSYRL
jgi:hypothetical protein